MTVRVTATTITIDGGEYTLEELYNEINNPSIMFKSGNYYRIKTDVFLKNNAYLKDENFTLDVDGSLFQIEKGSRFEVGRYENNIISGYSTVNIPNVKFGYGFGNTIYTNSGDFIAYGATLNIPCFWGFFEGTNTVKLIKCNIIGFGRVSGPESELIDCDLTQANGMYGGFSTKGEIKTYTGMNIFNSVTHNSNQLGPVRVAIYHNPRYAGDIVIKNAILAGYDDLAYIESYTGTNKLTVRDCDIRGSRTFKRESNNVDYYEEYTYKGIVKRLNGTRLGLCTMVIKNNQNEVVYNRTLNDLGEFEAILVTYKEDRNGNITEYNPFTVTITSPDNNVMEYKLDLTKRTEMDVYFNTGTTSDSSGSSSIDYNTLQTMLDSLKNDICGCTQTQTNLLGDRLNNIILALGEQVSETTEIVESHSDIKLIL